MRTDAETGALIPDCGESRNIFFERGGCKLPIGHTGAHMTDSCFMWYYDEEHGEVYRPEEWYKEHPA